MYLMYSIQTGDFTEHLQEARVNIVFALNVLHINNVFHCRCCKGEKQLSRQPAAVYNGDGAPAHNSCSNQRRPRGILITWIIMHMFVVVTSRGVANATLV